MSTYDFSQLVKHWGMEAITSEQAIGQILLHLQSLRERVTILEGFVPRSDQDEAVHDVGIEEATEEKLAPNAGIEGPTEEV